MTLQRRTRIIIVVILAVGAICVAAFYFLSRSTRNIIPEDITSAPQDGLPVAEGVSKVTESPKVIGQVLPEIKFVGPREGIPQDSPKDYGLWSFAMPVQGVLSRSGQPLFSGFKWMKENGWKGVVNLRVDGERSEVGDDRKIKGFNELDLNLLTLPIADGSPPTEEQAKQFLTFVTNPNNQPSHVHCRGGIGRAGTMVALYRYAVQGWPVDKAIEESRAFQGGVSESQKKWLENWAKNHASGEYKF